MGLCQCRRY
ncbi:hypothetical protein M5D96_010317 [Drosophila gunungcola]|uniref:Uncharacterized protein n=1 Tax=Drosophila gunungcola TaxID=103775 RepID=A0A9P9YHC9_9MUSC|nr:hypothetical protein M5D96_010317 [Drosophila gunungcola]